MSKTEQVRCASCNHVLVKNRFDKCSYCGAPLPKEFQTSKVEKEEILENLKKRSELEAKKIKREKSRSGSPSGSCGGFWSGGGDFGGGGGE